MGEEEEEGGFTSSTTTTSIIGAVPTLCTARQATLLQAIRETVRDTEYISKPHGHRCDAEYVECYLEEPVESARTGPLAYWVFQSLVWPDLAGSHAHQPVYPLSTSSL